MVLNLLLSHTPDQIKGLLEHSFATYLLLKKGRKKHSLSQQERHNLWNDFLRHLHFLHEKGFVSEDAALTADGRWASRLRIDQPLLVAQGLRLKILPDTDPALLAALVAAFVSDREYDDRLSKKLVPQRLLKAFLKMRRGLRPFAADMARAGFEVRSLFLKPAAAIYSWASGQPWDTVHSTYEMEEGDLAMLILRTADNLRHIHDLSEVFPQVSNTAAEAIEANLRDPVITEYA
jgi:superfamily II RNA helicase